VEFEFSLNGRKRRVKTDARSPSTDVTIDGETYEVDWTRVREGELSLMLDGRSHTVHVAPRDGGFVVQVEGRQFAIDTGRGDDDSAVAGAAAAGGGGKIRAPMPGNVVKVMVAEGDEVSSGTSLVVVEAMKMENEVRSPVDGVVTKVNVKAGDSVGTTEPMIVIEPAEGT
jgi:acetyl-CoA/propionyl-CoA carboxylase biotin carboxyl carrier protein